ncbi:hypothetical protein DL767_006808 [Monosporascus sp. MG133]|nr:hypothetical protein DL767_006808 [Monosporascus sp. MG133]
MPKEHAVEFEKIINAGRERKKNEELAARIFNRDSQRRSSAPIKATAGGSLASRVGVNKRLSSAARIPAGNVHTEWTHDLHQSQTGRDRPRAQQQPAPNSLAARVHAPGTALPKPPPTRPNRAAKLANAYARTTSSPAAAQQQINQVRPPPPQQSRGHGITIRGLAGPFVVMAQNFAPGTTAADIESAMTPVGGLISSCRLVKTHPIVIAEIVFENKEGADRVIETFHNQTADGRTLNVYMRPGGSSAPAAAPKGPRADESRARGNQVVVDGSMGFDDPMETDAGYADNYNGAASNGGLYSDNLVMNGTNGTSGGGGRRGRGFNRTGRSAR